MLQNKAWAVVGSHGKNPVADRLVAKLAAGGKQVWAVNPGFASGAVLGSLKDIGEPIDVVDLVINPAKGFGVVEELSAFAHRSPARTHSHSRMPRQARWGSKTCGSSPARRPRRFWRWCVVPVGLKPHALTAPHRPRARTSLSTRAAC
jgi:hypothetical protein